jgi:hypothetical protein
MSQKQSRKSSVSTLSPTRDDVEKLIQKDRLKDAVKQAKLLFREESTPENHRVLENAYFLRARQLLVLRMPDSALEVAEHLLEFGVTSAEWLDEFVRLLMDLGLADEAFKIQDQSGRPELKDQLIAIAADQVVIHPERIHDVSAEMVREARLIRESLEKLQAGDSEGGLLLLRELPRSSPLSDWKFFVRGLAAHYQGNSEETRANWDRLDGNRKARRIANRLERLGQLDEESLGEADFAVLEKQAFGEPVLARLAEMRRLLVNQEWAKVNRLLVLLRHSLRLLDRTFAERLTRILIRPIIHEASELDLDEAERLLKSFTRLAEPLAIDPSWNRFWAIASDLTEAGSAMTRDCWVKYVHDLETIPAFSPAERVLAQAMVWNRVAMLYRGAAEELETPDSMIAMFAMMMSMERPDPAERDRLKKQTLDCLEKSLKLAPIHLPTYRMLIDVHKHWKNGPKLEAAARRLLKRFPDDVETLALLLDSAIRQDRLDEAMSCIQRLRALKPLDRALRDQEAAVRIGLARGRAGAGCPDEGRDQFRAAEELSPDLRGEFSYLATKAIFEAKAGNRDESDRFLREAQTALPEPTALWLALAIESTRYRMTAATTKGYLALWTGDLKKKCQSQTAGEMANLLLAYVKSDVDYPGRAGQISQLLVYLKRMTRLKYRQIDIERVCDFLGYLPEKKNQDLLSKLVNHGMKQHPHSAQLHFQAGLVALAKSSPPFLNPDVARHVEKALELAEASKLPKEMELLPSIKKTLTLIKEMSASVRAMPFGSDFLPFGADGLGPNEDWGFDDPDDDFWDDDMVDDELEREPRSIPHAKPKKKKKSSKR